MTVRRALIAFATLGCIGLSMPTAVGSTVPAEPPLVVSATAVRAAMTCYGNLATSPIEPVLFLHGTGANSVADWSWNWNRAFQEHHWAYCDLDSPNHANSDLQVAAQYVVMAIRLMHRASGRAIGIVGHSQGGMVGRWALKYWPHTRAMVADYVGLAASNHGTAEFNLKCALERGCLPAEWQQSVGSAFLRALNAGPQTWPGINYTEIATTTDETILPYTSSFLPTAGNVTDATIQQICPLAVSEHDLMSASIAGWMLGIDALTHSGPGRLSRLNRSDCGAILMPGVDTLALPATLLTIGPILLQGATSPTAAAEPPIANYAR